ncbi:MAG: hypothetical protein WCD18_04910, partial [Thermosynechococcaceae cyanobacterium]
IQALPGAGLFGASAKRLRPKAITTASLTLRDTFAAEVLAEARWELNDLVWNFTDLIYDIDHADADTLAGRTSVDLKNAAIADLIVMLNEWAAKLNTLPPTPAEADQMAVSTAGYSPDQVNALRSHIAAFKPEQTELLRLRSEAAATRDYSRLVVRAQQMRTDGTLTPGAFDTLFGGSSGDFNTAIASFSAVRQSDPVELVLDVLERFYPVQLAGFRAKQPIDPKPGTDPATDVDDAQLQEIMAMAKPY